MHHWKIYVKTEEGWTRIGIAGVVVVVRSWFEEKSWVVRRMTRRHQDQTGRLSDHDGMQHACNVSKILHMGVRLMCRPFLWCDIAMSLEERCHEPKLPAR
jgi:hypothetical protein